MSEQDPDGKPYKHNEEQAEAAKETKDPLEAVNEFYRLLTDHEVPEGWSLGDLPPKMTGAEAFSLIYYLQQGPRVFPDHIEHCDGCDDLVDSWGEHIEYVTSKEQRLCESCYRAASAYECCACENHDCHSGPGRLLVVTKETQSLSPGLYKITSWPFYADGMITGHVFDNVLEQVGAVPEDADTHGYPMGFLCAACEKSTGVLAEPAPPPLPPSPPIMARRDQVVLLPSGRKYVVGKDHELPEGAQVVANRPHEDGDYSYCCGSDWCRCVQ